MFGVITSADLLDKAKRELSEYKKNPNVDNIFNLFVTIRHIEDYAKYKFATTKSRKKFHNRVKSHFGALYPWMLFVCNKQKHCKLTKGSGVAMDADHREMKMSGTFNGAPLNELPLNAGDQYRLEYKGVSYELGSLASQLIAKWDDFLR